MSMARQSEFLIGSCVWYSHKEFNPELGEYEDLRHAGVIVDIIDRPSGTVYFIAYCVKKSYEKPGRLGVTKDSKNGKAICLDTDRYFYKDNFDRTLISKLEIKDGFCPPELMSLLRASVGLIEKP